MELDDSKAKTRTADVVLNDLVPEWWDLFARKNAVYGDESSQGGGLGVKGLFPDFWRKARVIRSRLWEEQPEPDADAGEDTQQIIKDAIGHLFLLWAELRREDGSKSNAGVDELSPYSLAVRSGSKFPAFAAVSRCAVCGHPDHGIGACISCGDPEWIHGPCASQIPRPATFAEENMLPTPKHPAGELLGRKPVVVEDVTGRTLVLIDDMWREVR